jgi:hypothetical protein
LGIRRNESVPKGDREDSPGLRESMRPMSRVNEVNESGALKGRERCPEAERTKGQTNWGTKAQTIWEGSPKWEFAGTGASPRGTERTARG